jgi:oligoendopeptidase F
MVSRKVMVIISLIIFAALLLPSLAMAQTKAIPTRDQIPDKYKWNLTDFFPSDSAWGVGLEAVKARIPEIGKYQSKLGESASNLAQCLMLNDTLGMTAHRIYVYASLNLDEDNRVGKYQEMRDKAYAVFSQLNQATSFIEPEILKISTEKLVAFEAADKNLAVYKFYLDDIIRRKAHIRSEEIEQILAQAQPVTAGPSRIFTMIDDADVKFPNIKDEKGNEIEMTKGRFAQIMESPNRELRRTASETYSETYKNYSNALAATLSASVNGDLFYTEARGYKTCLERALDGDSIPEGVVDNLIKATNDNFAPLHKYIALRKKALAVDTLFGFDLGVPIVPQSKMEFTYEQAEDYMLKGLKPLGKEYLANVQKALDSRWIDVYENQGKGSGGYTWGTYTVHPIMLLNFTGTLTDVFTLAHEMGHMMNNYYSNQHEPYAYSGHSLFTAEVASTCNEAIMIKYMIDHTKDRNEKLYLLNYYIDQIIGTFYSQVWFTEYELKIHQEVESGGALSTDSFRKFYRDIFQKYYGPDFYIPADRDYGGLRISHFYRMYYVYQYASSYAASQMLSQKIMAGDKKAIAAYMEFIKTGSSAYPIDILKKAGVDMTTTEPYDNTIKVFSELVDEFERVLNSK